MWAEAVVGLALLLGLYKLIYGNFVKGAECRNETSLRGKTVLLTGGNTGIGKATALDLARRGARVVLACRSRERGEAAAYDIRRVHIHQIATVESSKCSSRIFPPPRSQETGNNEVLFMSLDLASLSSVRAFAEAFLRSEPRLDILINNAGVICNGKSEDGFNLVFQVNHLGHFLLTHLLLDRLKQCAPSRVVVVASDVHRSGKVDFQNVHQPVEGYLRAFQSYCNSKLANVLYVLELAKRLEGTNVTCYAVHPGAVHTEALRHSPRWLKHLYNGFTWLFFRDPENGAQTSIYCATQEGIEKFSGCYFENCRQQDPNPRARDDGLAKKLWEFSDRLLGLAS